MKKCKIPTKIGNIPNKITQETYYYIEEGNMNNYYNFEDYYEDIFNTSFNNPNMNMNKSNKMYENKMNKQKEVFDDKMNQPGLYNPYQGFIRGNVFTNLYNPYLSTEPYEIKPINKQAEMLTNIDALGFAMIDLNLYLDVYPNDKGIIELYSKYRDQKEDLIKKYEKEYGPLTTMSKELDKTPWAWDNKPWPWQ